MSKAKTPIKVLRTALKRVQRAWSDKTWSEKGDDGNYYVCLEGAIYGFCRQPTTQAQRDAHAVCLQIVKEKYGAASIPNFNDESGRTQEQVAEVIKLGIIRLETGGMDDPEGDYIDPEEVDDLLG